MRPLATLLPVAWLLLLSFPSHGLDWIPVAMTGSPAPGLPGETLDLPNAVDAFVGPGAVVRFTSSLESEPYASSSPHFFYWALDGTVTPPLEPVYSALPPSCGSSAGGVMNAAGDLALELRGFGGGPECDVGALLAPDEANELIEILPFPDPVLDPGEEGWVRTSSRPIGMNAARQVLVETGEFLRCTVFCGDVRLGLQLVQGSTTQLIAVERETSAPDAGNDAQVRYLVSQGTDGPNGAGAIVFTARVGVDCAYDDCAEALYRWDPVAGLALVAITGDAASDVEGATFDRFGSPRLAEDGSIVFYAWLGAGAGIDETNDTGVWIRDAAGTRLLFRESAETGWIDPTLFRNRSGSVALGTGFASLVDAVWTVREASGTASLRARSSDPRPDVNYPLGSLEILHLSDGDKLLLRAVGGGGSGGTHYLVRPDDSLSVLTVDGQAMPFGPGDIRPTVALQLAHDEALEQFLLAAYPQSPPLISALFYAVPEPDPSATGWIAIASLGAGALRARPRRHRRTRELSCR
jgi:hypothetical protein